MLNELPTMQLVVELAKQQGIKVGVGVPVMQACCRVRSPMQLLAVPQIRAVCHPALCMHDHTRPVRLQVVSPGCVAYLAAAVEAHMVGLLRAMAKASKQRADPGRWVGLTAGGLRLLRLGRGAGAGPSATALPPGFHQLLDQLDTHPCTPFHTHIHPPPCSKLPLMRDEPGPKLKVLLGGIAKVDKQVRLMVLVWPGMETSCLH